MSFTSLPDPGGLRTWDHVFLPEGVRDRLLRRVVFTMRNRSRLAGMRSALQGIVLLSGPPGTGKSTTARMVANKAAELLADEGDSSLTILDPHSLPSSSLGESQQNVAELMGPVLSEYGARTAFVFIVVDEVEALAVRRSSASFETNPVDVHRATDALLEGLDQLLFANPNILLLMTTNFPEAVDPAVISRVDEVIDFELPSSEQIMAILRDTLDEFAEVWPGVARLAGDDGALAEVAEAAAGLSGRDVRKLVTSAVLERDETTAEPGLLEVKDFQRALSRHRDGSEPVG